MLTVKQLLVLCAVATVVAIVVTFTLRLFGVENTAIFAAVSASVCATVASQMVAANKRAPDDA